MFISPIGVPGALMLRLRRESIDKRMLSHYVVDDFFTYRFTNDHVILEWKRNDEEGVDGEWDDPEGWMAQLVPIRDEIERGDYRTLYLGWLSSLSLGYEYDSDDGPDDEEEPPVPAGLGSLTAAQSALAEFLGIDRDFLNAAAVTSLPPPDPSLVEHEMSKWVADIPRNKANDYLLLLLQGKSRQAERMIGQDFAAHLRDHRLTEKDTSPGKTRSVVKLLEEVERCKAKRLEREKRQRERTLQELRRRRESYLTELAKDFGRHWKQAHELAARGIASAQDRALDLLVDLSEAYSLKQKPEEFSRLIAEFHATHAKRTAFLKKLDKAGLNKR